MCDEFEAASELETFLRDVALANRKPPMAFTGFCASEWCGEKISKGMFCDDGCREDHRLQQLEKINKQRDAA